MQIVLRLACRSHTPTHLNFKDYPNHSFYFNACICTYESLFNLSLLHDNHDNQAFIKWRFALWRQTKVRDVYIIT